jgi:hypothetical protein
MSNPTTPFGWQMPEATDLVTDLPADFEVFGQAVATDLQYLLGGTTGQVLAKASGTDLDFVWSADAAGMTNPMTTTADVIYSSSGSTPARLGIGTANQVLAVNSGATAPEWQTISAPSMTLISTTTLTGASVSLTSIPQTYTDLRLVIRDFYPATNDATIGMTFNADTSGNYTFVRTRSTSTAVSENVGASNFPFNDRSTQQTNTDTNARAVVNIYDYATALDQVSDGIFVYFTTGSATAVVTFGLTYFPSTSAAITSIQLAPNSGNFGGGTALLYGVK